MDQDVGTFQVEKPQSLAFINMFGKVPQRNWESGRNIVDHVGPAGLPKHEANNLAFEIAKDCCNGCSTRYLREKLCGY